MRDFARLRCLVYHGIGVLDTAAVSAALLFENAHERIVMFLAGPIALPLEQRSDGGEANGACLNHAREGRLLSGAGRGAAAIVHDVDCVSGGDHRERGPGHADFRPKPRQDDVLATRRLDGGTEAGVIPRVHRGALKHGTAGEHVQQLRPNIAAEALRFDRGEHRRHAELLGDAGEEPDVVDEPGPVDVRHAKEHLRLVVNEDDGAVFRCIEAVIVGHEGDRRMLFPPRAL